MVYCFSTVCFCNLVYLGTNYNLIYVHIYDEQKNFLWAYLIFYLAPMRTQPTDCLSLKITAVFTKIVAIAQVVTVTGHFAKTRTVVTTKAMDVGIRFV